MAAPVTLRLRAHFRQVRAIRSDDAIGVQLDFAPLRARVCGARSEHFANLHPEHGVASVRGLGLVLRILRTTRIATPESLVGEPEAAALLLELAAGTKLELRARSRVRFIAWTHGAVDLESVDASADDCVVIDDVRGVREAPDAW